MKYINIPLNAGVTNAQLPELIEAPQLTSVVNLRSPRKLGVPSRVMDVTPTPAFGGFGTINVTSAPTSGHNTYLNAATLVIPPQIMTPYGARTTATGLTAGATIQNAWVPVEVTDVIEGVLGQVQPDNFTTCLLDNGITMVAAYVQNAPYFIVTAIDSNNNVIISQFRVDSYAGAGSASYKTSDKTPSRTLPIRMLAHAHGICSVWYTTWSGPTTNLHYVNFGYIDTNAPTAALLGITTLGPWPQLDPWMQWGVTTHPEAGNTAWLASPLTGLSSSLSVTSFNVTTGVGAPSFYLAPSTIDKKAGWLDIASVHTSTGIDWVSVAYNHNDTVNEPIGGSTHTFTINGSTFDTVMEDVNTEGITLNRWYDGLTITHACDGGTLPQVLIMSFDGSSDYIATHGTRITTRVSGSTSGSFDRQLLPAVMPYGRASMWKESSTLFAPIVPFVRCFNVSASLPTPITTVHDAYSSLTNTFYVQDPSLDVKLFRSYDASQHLYTATTILRAGVDELLTRYGHPLNCIDVRGTTGVLSYARDDQADITNYGDGLKLLRFEINPQAQVRTQPLVNNSLIAAGQPMCWDGKELVEVGFPHQPILEAFLLTGSSVNGALAPGTYGIQAYYQWRNAQGELHRSACSQLVTVEMTSPQIVQLSIPQPDSVRTGKTNFAGTNNSTLPNSLLQTEATLALYVTEKDGDVPYQSALTVSGTLVNSYLFIQAVASSSNTYPPIYTAGGELEPTAPPAMWDVTEVGNRLFAIDATNRSRVFFTKPKQYGIAYEWNTFVNTFQVDESAGRLIAIRELGGYPVILAEKGIYTVQGDGPDTFGNGSYSAPIRISAYNCHGDCRQMAITTPHGLFLLGVDGYYAVMPGPSPTPPQTIYSYHPSSPAVSSAWIPTTEELLVFNQAETITVDMQQLRIAECQWSAVTSPHRFINTQFDGQAHQGGWLISSSSLYRVSDTYLPDTHNTWSIETGWITPNTSFGECVFDEFVLDCVYLAAGASVQIEQYFNYDDVNLASSTTKSATHITTANALSPGRVRLRFKATAPNQGSVCNSAKVRITCRDSVARTGETILPISLVVTYDDDLEKVPTLSRQLAGDIDDN